MTQDRYLHGEDLPRHPSLGIVQFTRVQGQKLLHGNSMESHNFIRLRISTARANHGYGTTHYWDDKLVTEVQLSAIQFSELITQMNTGCGVPCTFEYKPKDGYTLERPEQPDETMETEAGATRRQYKTRMADCVEEIGEAERALKVILADAKLSKKNKDRIFAQVNGMIRMLTDSAPFAMQTFEEACERATTRAKTEVSAFIEGETNRLGMEALKERNMELITGGSDYMPWPNCAPKNDSPVEGDQ